jgi:hypothetical protein
VTIPVGNLAVLAGTVVSITADATDPDGDSLNFRWAVDGDSVAGAIGNEFEACYSPAQTAQHTIAVTVSDGEYITTDSIALDVAAVPASGRLLLTAVVDGPLAGGTPKTVELFAPHGIADLSEWGLGVANNGGGSPGVEFALSGKVAGGSYLYVASEAIRFAGFFGFPPDFTTTAMNINGNDAVGLYYQDAVVDRYGDPDLDATGQPWEYTDGWAYRHDFALSNPLFLHADWKASGVGALDGELVNAAAAVPVPLAAYLSCAG